jgi:hypothetical protein
MTGLVVIEECADAKVADVPGLASSAKNVSCLSVNDEQSEVLWVDTEHKKPARVRET